jgi:hypothetical protein
MTTTFKARVRLERREREYRIKELRRLLATHKRDANFRRSVTGWRKELLGLHEKQASDYRLP